MRFFGRLLLPVIAITTLVVVLVLIRVGESAPVTLM